MRHLLLALLTACTACTAAQRPVTAETPGALPELLRRLHALSAASACTASAECATVAVGAKACGGPEYYLAFSPDKLPQAREVAGRHAALRQEANAREPEQRSNCRFIPDPGAACQSGRCVPAAGGGARQ